MASITSRPSPNSSAPYDFESPNDSDESWQHIGYYDQSAPSSIGFLPSPASGSLNGYAVIGTMARNSASPSAPSPLALGEMDPAVWNNFPDTSFSTQTESAGTDVFATTTDGGFVHGDTAFLTPQGYLFQQQEVPELTAQQLNDIAPLMNSFETEGFSFDQSQQAQIDLNIPHPLQSDPNVPPWNPTSPRGADGAMFVFDDFSSSPKSMYSQSSASQSSPVLKSGPNSRSPSQMRRVKASKVEKKKADQAGKFVIMTPTTISAHAGRPNPFECFEAMRTSQRGRKGPLANATKENALQVRRLGACFCCHSRKVKCDQERPCKNCKKLCVQVPQIVCWRFADFLPVLFPTLVHGHLKREMTSTFIKENVSAFNLEQAYMIQLFSGSRFSTVFSVQASFFTPKTPDVLQHWHLKVNDRISLESNGSAPLGVDPDDLLQRDSLKKKAKAYVQDTVNEPAFVDQVTESFNSTSLPKKVLDIVKRFADQSNSLMVKRSLSIYCMHYILTRQLCLTQQTIDALRPTGLVPQNSAVVTSRILARQIKSIIGDMLKSETSQLFELFGKSLKPKSRREWAPCLAAFLVLCLFMEAVEIATDVFVINENEVCLQNGDPPLHKRSVALDLCKEVDNMPFKQFAYQFHQVYQTHSKDANAKSFNPLFDNSFAEQGELDLAAIEMVAELKELFYGDSWLDMQFLTADDILPNTEQHPYPRDPALIYTGRLVAKFLMSFDNEKVIFDS